MNFVMISIVFFSFAFLLPQIKAECPNDGAGWTLLENTCYLMSQDKMTWYEAKEFCWGHGGYLAEIKSKWEEDALDQYLLHDLNFWIGLTDQATEGYHDITRARMYVVLL